MNKNSRGLNRTMIGLKLHGLAIHGFQLLRLNQSVIGLKYDRPHL
jgi:hypothetical protein